MSVNLALLGTEPISIMVLALSIILVKGTVLFCIGRLQGMNNTSARQLAFSISQGGEFAFVIFAATLTLGILNNDITETLIVAVTITMILTPLILMANDYLSAKNTEKNQEYDTPEDENNQVIIAGFGRFG